MKRLLPADPNARVVTVLAGVVVTMGALAWASVPFYDWFCRVTGYGGTTAVAETGSDTILDETITVRFDANTAPGMPWEFTPLERKMTVRIGETTLAYYRAHNPTDRPVAGQAVFNVAPTAAGGYFAKIDCFCFTLQVLGPGETVDMPVSFYVDPALREDADGRGVHAITLSYTMYPEALPEGDITSLDTGALPVQNTTN